MAARVDWIVEERTGTKVALKLDKDSMLFEATFAGVTIRNASGGVVRDKILGLITEHASLDFVPIIKILINSVVKEDVVDLKLGIERIAYAETDLGMYFLRWTEYEKNDVNHPMSFDPMRRRMRGDEREFHLPIQLSPGYSYQHEIVWYLPYDERVWAALNQFKNRLDSLPAWIERAVNSVMDDDCTALFDLTTDMPPSLNDQAPEEEK